MRKIIIITALCVCAIGLILIVNKPNTQEIYSNTGSHEYKLQKQNITSNNAKKFENIVPTNKTKVRKIQKSHQYKRATLTSTTKKTELLNVVSNGNNTTMSQSNNNRLTTYLTNSNLTKGVNQNIGIENFAKVSNINSSLNNSLLKKDGYITMQFAFPDEGQLNNPGATPLNNELILLILAGLFIFYKKN